MSWQRKKGLLYETNLLNFPWLKHFFTLRINGDLRNQQIQKGICKKENIDFSKIVIGEQVHGNRIFSVGEEQIGKRIPSVDGLFTRYSGAPLVIFTADCLPIFFVEKEKRTIGIIHAGRKGTEKQITYKAVKTLEKKYNSSLEKILVAIGPHIHFGCYPVDLTRLNYEQLLSAGVRKKNIFISRYCTACRNDLFFSYRKEKENAGRMMGLIMLKA